MANLLWQLTASTAFITQLCTAAPLIAPHTHSHTCSGWLLWETGNLLTQWQILPGNLETRIYKSSSSRAQPHDLSLIPITYTNCHALSKIIADRWRYESPVIMPELAHSERANG